jgi:hypothetical protein
MSPVFSLPFELFYFVLQNDQGLNYFPASDVGVMDLQNPCRIHLRQLKWSTTPQQI